MKCTSCGSSATEVKDSRPAAEDTSIRRRRRCASCQARFTTYEVVMPEALLGDDGDLRSFAAERVLETISLLGSLPVEEHRLLLALARSLAGKSFPLTINLGRVA